MGLSSNMKATLSCLRMFEVFKLLQGGDFKNKHVVLLFGVCFLDVQVFFVGANRCAVPYQTGKPRLIDMYVGFKPFSTNNASFMTVGNNARFLVGVVAPEQSCCTGAKKT